LTDRSPDKSNNFISDLTARDSETSADIVHLHPSPASRAIDGKMLTTA
jgi:hypothetical protein